MPARVIELAAHRAKRRSPPAPKVAPAHLFAEAGTVVLEFAGQFDARTERLQLSPAHARAWAERLLAMADTAEALEGSR